MRLPFLALPLLFLLTACPGQLRDYIGPISNITSPQLLRYGLNVAQARCVGENMGQTLRPHQLRAFTHAAASFHAGSGGSGNLTFRDLMWVANQMGDGQVPPALRRADGACGVAASIDYARQLAEADAEAARRAASPAAPPAPSVPAWLNLGAAPSGQTIAINAATIQQDGSQRRAWFRLTDPGQPASLDSFLLAIDCAHRTINARARERRDASGAVVQHIDYPDNPLRVEGGTVMEIAWLSLCT